MSQLLRKALSDELLRRHGYRTMEAKIKPVHIANALMRVEHQCVGRMSVLEQLFVATYKKNSTEQRVAAVQAMIAGQKERWGALGQVNDVPDIAFDDEGASPHPNSAWGGRCRVW